MDFCIETNHFSQLLVEIPLYNLQSRLHLIMEILHTSPSTLKPLDSMYHSILRFITGDYTVTHHCILFLLSKQNRAALHVGYISYPCFLSTVKYNSYDVSSQDILTLAVPLFQTELGKSWFKCFAPCSNVSNFSGTF